MNLCDTCKWNDTHSEGDLICDHFEMVDKVTTAELTNGKVTACSEHQVVS